MRPARCWRLRSGSRPAIRSRSTGETGRRNVQEQLQVQQVRFLGAHSRNGYDTVGLRIFTATIDYDIEVANGKVVRGDKVLTS